MKVAQVFRFKSETKEANRRSRPTRKLSIAYKLTVASLLMITLTLLAGGIGLWQVITIGQAISDAHEKEQQRAWSLELLASGHRLVAALNGMLLTEDPFLASTEVAVSLGSISLYVETLQESGVEAGASGLLEEMQVAYDELRQAVSEVDQLARQERWTEARAVMEQKVRSANERMALLTRRLVRQADQDAQAVAERTQVVVQQAALLLVVIVVLTTAVAWGWRQVVFRGLSRSIAELRQGVSRISSGDLEYELDVQTGDEIEELSDEFNKMADELANVIGSLEQRVADRTRGLQTAAEVSRAITSVLDPEELLDLVVNLARERFNLYYVGLFLVEEELGDSGRTFAVLRAGTGEAGRKMLELKHKLEVGSESMIGQCVARDEARIALDVGQEAVRFVNPHLPDTRSEMALPLRARGQVIGAMSVQSTEEAAFDEADISVLQTMADQVAVAIDNAQLFADAETTLDEMENIQRRYLGQAWAEYLQTTGKIGYETKRPDAPPLGDAVLPEVQQAVAQERAVALQSYPQAPTPPHSALVAPVALRGAVIGALGIHDDEARQWTEEELALINAVAERMALAADNLRLLDETQRRAAHEQLVGQIASQVRSSLDPDAILQTTVRELGRALGAASVAVEVTGPDENDDGSLGENPTRKEEE
jgi:GAF domain-containing protein/HAMP domain-containing protein